MRLILMAVFVVGCADAMGVTPAPDLGPGHGDGGGADGGAEVAPVCNAAVEMLSGRATYVMGSAMAADPTAMASAGETCGAWAAGVNLDAIYTDLTVTAGKVGANALVLVGAASIAGGCTYTLALTTPAPPTLASCLVARNYVLVVP